MSKGRKGRSPDQIRKDRVEIAALYLQGWTQAEIGAKLGLSRQQIGYDLEAVRREWLQSSLIDFHAKRAQELAKIDHLEQQYWAAWEASKKERQSTTTEQTTAAEGERLKAGIRKVERAGDPRFLVGVQWCVTKRCEILGLNAPRKIAPTTPDGERPYQLVVKDLTDEELDAIEHLAERYPQLALGPGAGGLN
jgi:Homeodomain-like domain